MSSPNIVVASRNQGSCGASGRGWKLPLDMVSAGLLEVRKKATELGLDLDPAKRVAIVGKQKDGTIGTDKAVDISIVRYQAVWKPLLSFCILIKDYESAIILDREQCPADPTPVSLDTAIHCLRFFALEKGTVLLHHRTGQPVKDGSGQTIACLGSWKSKNSVDLFRTALTKLHNHYPTTQGDYVEACPNCNALGIDATKERRGCHRHLDAPRFWRSGNVGRAVDFKTKHDQMVEYAKEHYTCRATIALLPFELRKLRTYLLAQNTLYHMMLWTIILVGTKAFLRVQDEALTLTMEQFQTDYFVVNATDVEGLCVQVKGKSDTDTVNLMLWDDKECPDLSPSRIVLLWIALSGIEGGFLFPTREELGEKQPTTGLSYSTILNELKKMFEIVLGKDLVIVGKDVIVGTHMLRHSGYLNAYWSFKSRNIKIGDMDGADLAQSARHADMNMAMSYLSDSGTLQALVERTPVDLDVDNSVGLWKPIHVKTHSSFSQLNISSRRFHRPLYQLAIWYLRELLQIPVQQSNISTICAKACRFKPDQSLKEKYMRILKSNFSPEMCRHLMGLIEQDHRNKLRLATQQAADATNDSTPFSLLPQSSEAADDGDSDAPIQPPPSKKQKPASELVVPD